MRRLFRFKYPKIALLAAAIVIAYFIFRNPAVGNFFSSLGALSWLGIFIAGMLFTFGFTAPLSAGFFLTLNPGNVLAAGLVGGIGAMLSDLLIFRLIKISFMGEFMKLKKERISKEIKHLVCKVVRGRARAYLMYAFAGILIASPLPDEAGIIMLAGLAKIKANALAAISFLLNTAGILVLLGIGAL